MDCCFSILASCLVYFIDPGTLSDFCLSLRLLSAFFACINSSSLSGSKKAAKNFTKLSLANPEIQSSLDGLWLPESPNAPISARSIEPNCRTVITDERQDTLLKPFGFSKSFLGPLEWAQELEYSLANLYAFPFRAKRPII